MRTAYTEDESLCHHHVCDYGGVCTVNGRGPVCVCPTDCPDYFEPVCLSEWIAIFFLLRMYVCMYESICNEPLLQPKQSGVRAHRLNRKCVFSLIQKSVNVIVGSRIDGGREFHNFGAQAAKLRGPKLVVRQARTCRSPRAAERIDGDDLY